MDIRQNGVLGKPAPSGIQPWAFTVHTVSLFLFLAFLKRVRAKPLGKGNCFVGSCNVFTQEPRNCQTVTFHPHTPHCAQGRADKVLQAGVSWGGVIKELAPTAPILSHIIQGMVLDAALLQPCMRVSLAQKAILIPHPPVAYALSMAHLILGLPESLPNLQVRITSPISQCAVLIPVKTPITQHCNCR